MVVRSKRFGMKGYYRICQLGTWINRAVDRTIFNHLSNVFHKTPAKKGIFHQMCSKISTQTPHHLSLYTAVSLWTKTKNGSQLHPCYISKVIKLQTIYVDKANSCVLKTNEKTPTTSGKTKLTQNIKLNQKDECYKSLKDIKGSQAYWQKDLSTSIRQLELPT